MPQETTAWKERLGGGVELLRADPDEGTFAGWGVKFDTPVETWIPTVFEQGAFQRTLQRHGSQVKVLREHNPEKLIGTATAEEREEGLWLEGRISDTSEGRDARTLMRDGILDRMSIGLDPGRWEIEERSSFPWVDGQPLNGDLRRITRVDRLWEGSLVAFPANDAARVMEVHSAVDYQDLSLTDRGREWDAQAAESRIREWAGGDEVDFERYREAHAWYDEDAPEELGSYKLPIADVVDGELVAVPRAVFAAAAAIQGARGGVDIPDSDRPSVRAHLERYYGKMREQFDDDSITPPWKREQEALGVLEPVLSRGLDISITEVTGARIAEAIARGLVDEYGLTISDDCEACAERARREMEERAEKRRRLDSQYRRARVEAGRLRLTG